MGEHGGAGSKESGGADQASDFTARGLERLASLPGAPAPSPFLFSPDPSSFDSRVGRAEYERRLAVASRAFDQPLEILVHFSFEAGRALYDAAGIVSRHAASARSTLDFIHRELDLVSARLRDRRRAVRLHLGGAPALYAPRELLAFLADLVSRFPPLTFAELSADLDPRVTTDAHLDAFAGFGFDRAWIGVEDFAAASSGSAAPAASAAVSRVPVSFTARALRRARLAGFSSLAVDLVCGLPHHTGESIDGAAATAIELGFDRIAIRLAASSLGQAGIETAARERLERAGYLSIDAYEFALASDPLSIALRDGTLRRAIGGWTAAPRGDCIGLGVGAVSDVAGAWFQNAPRLEPYEDALLDWTLPIERGLVRDHGRTLAFPRPTQ